MEDINKKSDNKENKKNFSKPKFDYWKYREFKKLNRVFGKTIKWNDDNTFIFLKNTRPEWTDEAVAIKVNKGEDRRHGLHGSDILTQTCQILLNDELKRTGKDKMSKRLLTNMSSRGVTIPKNITLDGLIEIFRECSFSKTNNLLAGNGNYNRGIQQAKTKIERMLDNLHQKFFSEGQLPYEIKLEDYQNKLLNLLYKSIDNKTTNEVTLVANYIIKDIVIPMIVNGNFNNANDIDQALILIRDTTKIDIAFSSSKGFKKFNKKVLEWDAKLKQAINRGKGLSEQIFNLLIGYRKSKQNKKIN